MLVYTKEDIPDGISTMIRDYLPPNIYCNDDELPFITLAYAQSLDSRISKRFGMRTIISHKETKVVTQYIRFNHDAILVGINTVIADDPGLNCRFQCGSQNLIRPVIIDPDFKIPYVYKDSKLSKNFNNNLIGMPIIVVSSDTYETTNKFINKYAEANSLDILTVEPQMSAIMTPFDGIQAPVLPWYRIFKKLKQEIGIESVMVEGGAQVIQSLLMSKYRNKPLVDSLIITVGPVFLGKRGVEVSPAEEIQLKDVKWWAGKRDSVMFSKVKKIFEKELSEKVI